MTNGEEKPKAAYCPNCNGPALKSGNEITCEKCDGVFTISRAGVKVKSIGSIQDHENRIAALEEKTGIKQQDQDQEPAPGQDQDQDQEVEDDL